MRNLIEHLPPFFREIKEYKQVCSVEEIELENLENKIEEIIKEVSIETASGYGLDKYEEILNIVKTTDNTEERRFKIKSKLTNQLPFNMKWLDNKLKSLVGNENYKITLDAKNYSITIQISHVFPDVATVINNDLRQQLPANLIITVNLFRTETVNLHVAGLVHIGKFIKVGGAN